MKKLLALLIALLLIISAFAAMPVYAIRLVYGDVNNDTYINAKDTLLLRRFVAKQKVSMNEEAADCEFDGKINSKDVLLLRKFVAKQPVVLGPAAETYDETSYTLGKVKDQLALIGRGQFDKNYLRCDYINTGFEVLADCEGDVTVRFAITGQPGWLGLVVDGDVKNIYSNLVQTSDTKTTFKCNLTAGVHRLRVLKLNEFNIYSSGTHLTFKEITVNGSLKDYKKEEKSLKIEFYGDSLTCGYGNLCSNGTSGAAAAKYQNGMKTFGALTAAELNADYSFCAASGHGIYCGNGGSTGATLNAIVDKLIDEDGSTGWDYSFDADIVVITLGTNDANYANNNKVTIDNDTIKTEAKKLIDNIRKHNPDCDILWLTGISGVPKNSYCDVDTSISELAKTVENMTYYNQMPRSQSGGDGHPSEAQHEYISSALVSLIKDLYGQKYGLK